MKKFNQFKVKLFAMAAFAMMANVAVAQNLKVTRNGAPVADGDVIDLKWVLDEEYVPEWDMSFYYCTWDPHLEVSTETGTAMLAVTVTSIDNTNGFSICWPETCLDILPNDSKTSTGVINTVPADLEIHKIVDADGPDWKPSEPGTILVKLTAGSETMEVTVKALVEKDTGVWENVVENNLESSYYTLQGIRVASPQKGHVYIERKGGKSVKRLF